MARRIARSSEIIDPITGTHYYNQVGEAYLYFGSTLASWIPLELPYTVNDPSGSYPNVSDRLWGWDVAMGNLVGDNQEDVIVAAYNSENPVGGVYVGNAGWIRVFRDYSAGPPPGFAQTYDVRRPAGDSSWINFGWSVALGSYDSDGYRDLVVGAPWEGLVLARGEVNVFWGGSVFPTQSFSFDRGGVGIGQAMDKFGSDVDVLDDQDGDGLAELISGAPFFNGGPGLVDRQGPGTVFLRRSQTGLSAHFDDPSPEIIPGERYGWGSALCVGLLDSNMAIDFVIGDPRATRLGFAKAGEIRVVIY